MIPRRFIAAALVAIALVPTVGRACVPAIGVHPDAFLRAIALPGRIASAISVAAAFAWLLATRKPGNNHGIALIGLAILNPGWWLWGIGDCGELAFEIGGSVAVLSLVTLSHGVWTRRAARQAHIPEPSV